MSYKLTVERLKELLIYDAETGVFLRRIKRSNRQTGSVAGSPAPDGYVRICIDKTFYLAHRLAWLYVHGVWPQKLIDHKNRNPRDNRISNLRLADRVTNGANAKLCKRNTSGLRGVSYIKRDKKWRASIKAFGGPSKNLGHFDTKEEAHRAYIEAAKTLFGEYANMWD